MVGCLRDLCWLVSVHICEVSQQCSSDVCAWTHVPRSCKEMVSQVQEMHASSQAGYHVGLQLL